MNKIAWAVKTGQVMLSNTKIVQVKMPKINLLIRLCVCAEPWLFRMTIQWGSEIPPFKIRKK